MRLIVASYSDDPERKRIEYTLEKWSQNLRIGKPDGIVAIVDGNEEDISNLVKELYSRTSPGSITQYHIEKIAADVSPIEREITLDLREKRETVERLLGFVMARQKAILKRESASPFERTYEVYRKGKVEISVMLREEGDIVRLRLSLKGYAPAVEYLHTKLNDDLKYFKGQ